MTEKEETLVDALGITNEQAREAVFSIISLVWNHESLADVLAAAFPGLSPIELYKVAIIRQTMTQLCNAFGGINYAK